MLPTVSEKNWLVVSLTQEENNKYYDHCEKHFVPEPCYTAPDPQVENTLPSATTHKDKMTINYRKAVFTQLTHYGTYSKIKIFCKIPNIVYWYVTEMHIPPFGLLCCVNRTSCGSANLNNSHIPTLAYYCSMLLLTFGRRWKVNREWQECQSPHRESRQPQSIATSSLVKVCEDKMIKRHMKKST